MTQNLVITPVIQIGIVGNPPQLFPFFKATRPDGVEVYINHTVGGLDTVSGIMMTKMAIFDSIQTGGSFYLVPLSDLGIAESEMMASVWDAKQGDKLLFALPRDSDVYFYNAFNIHADTTRKLDPFKPFKINNPMFENYNVVELHEPEPDPHFEAFSAFLHRLADQGSKGRFSA